MDADSFFDSDGFADQFDSPVFGLLDQTDQQPNQPGDSGDDEIIFGFSSTSSPAGNGRDSWPSTGSGTTEQIARTVADLDAHRIDRARSDTAAIPHHTPAKHGRGNDERRITEQNDRAAREALRRLQTSGAITGDAGLPLNTGRVKTWNGVKFEAVLHRLFLTNNGEWIVQFRVQYEDKAQARELDNTAGMTLIVSVEQV